MRFREFAPHAVAGAFGVDTFVTGEEFELLDRFRESDTISRDDLSERERVVADGLTEKSVLDRNRDERGIWFRPARLRKFRRNP